MRQYTEDLTEHVGQERTRYNQRKWLYLNENTKSDILRRTPLFYPGLSLWILRIHHSIEWDNKILTVNWSMARGIDMDVDVYDLYFLCVGLALVLACISISKSKVVCLTNSILAADHWSAHRRSLESKWCPMCPGCVQYIKYTGDRLALCINYDQCYVESMPRTTW